MLIEVGVRLEGRIIGFVRYGKNDDPMYRVAGIDLFLDPEAHGRARGRDADWVISPGDVATRSAD